MPSQRDPTLSSPAALKAAETSNMLKLCAAQTDGALGDCDAAIERLLEAFTTIVEDSQWLRRKAETMAGQDAQVAAELDMRSNRLVTKANAAIQALQFHDRLTQRLGHVRHSLSSLGELVTDTERSSRQEDWQELHARLGRMYRTREEVAIFEAVTGMRHASANAAPAAAANDIELF
ncbi:MAG: hypothetical protein ABL964_11570 [Steroidobacteraceae bacterium]